MAFVNSRSQYAISGAVTVAPVDRYGGSSVDAISQQVLAKTLFDQLMSDYDSSLIPLCNSASLVTVNMDIALRQIMDINEREQILTTNLWLRLRWNDCRLTWEPMLYNNLTFVTVTYNDVWVPDITLYDRGILYSVKTVISFKRAAEGDMLPGIKNNRAYISSSGSVTYNFPTVAKSICKINVRYFPFDTQECPLQFGSWSHHSNELDMVNSVVLAYGLYFYTAFHIHSLTIVHCTGDLDYYIDNTEWTVSDFPIERHVLYYNCCPEPYPDVTFYVIMKRRSTFYILTMIFPYTLTAFVSALGFVLPVESGEKVLLQVTVLLSLAVFILLISESLPPSSDNFPVIGTYFATSMAFVSASLVQTVIVLNVFYRGSNGRTVPSWARIIFFHCIGTMLCVRTKKLHVVNLVGEMTGDNRSADEDSLYNGKDKLVLIGKYDKDLKATSEYCELKSPYPTKTEKLADKLASNNTTTDKTEKAIKLHEERCKTSYIRY
ncbi:neuronal acetylcholine receptor subunit alpha-10-like [Mercenaria mercenaria]|uniref:neuronal acetylcholine receptor subunit alpha-10-like n=1 Tax=Mercenaria mercenaria TaxID=6596 RepID=UPI00234F34A5|nr:neuronal acetylcholine receptor subunit alpha-10-like [Mercenaria mercenaria]